MRAARAFAPVSIARGLSVPGMMLAALTQTTACLDDPPTFAPRGQIPPFVVVGQVSPPVNLVFDGPDSFVVNAPFRSEDVNVDLLARLYLDLVPGASRSSHGGQQEIAAGNYEDDKRSAIVDYTEPVPDGCHTITMILTYQDNFNAVTLLPLDDTRAARVVWWLNVDDVDGDTAMSSCPNAQQADSQ